jgi:hypothetical protein
MSDKIKPALFGGLIIGLISGIPFLNLLNCLCCAGVLFGGLMSVYFYKQDLPPGGPGVTSSDSMQLGALAGVIGAITGNIIAAIILLAAGNVAGQAMLSFFDSSGILDKMPPEAVDQMERNISTGGLSVFTVIFSIVIDVIFGLLGGLIGYSMFKQKNPMPPQMPPMTPPR